MDAVITYVNMNDPVWKEQYRQTFVDEPNTHRYKDLGTIELQIKCIRKFMPWIDQIFVVVSTSSQVSDLGDAIVITHDQIIPTEYLPTFNSCTIEMFLHNIPNLSEYFVYFNDDMIPIAPLNESEFFDDQPILSFKTVIEPPVNTYRHQCKNSDVLARIIAGVPSDSRYVKTDHICCVHSKDAFRKVWSKADKTIRKSLTKTRSTTNFNQYLFADYLLYSNQCKIKRLDYKFIEYQKVTPNTLYDIISNQRYKLICLQDNNRNDDFDRALVNGLRSILDNNSIDLVVPYVDCDDRNWQKLYKQYVSSDDGYGASTERFRSWDMFRYFFRGIDRYMPFIRNVILIVQSDTQVPEWLDRRMVRVVKHEEFIPKEYLPVFNSCTIEMFMHNIPGLSERFIYANDDEYILSDASVSDFFEDNKPVFGYALDDFHDNWPTDYIRYNIHKLVTGKNDKKVERIQHIFMPYLKSTVKEVFDKYHRQIIDSITRVRDSKNLSQWLYAVYQVYNKEFKSKYLPHVKTSLRKDKVKYISSAYKFVCLNDKHITSIEDVNAVAHALQSYFPNKSRFEI